MNSSLPAVALAVLLMTSACSSVSTFENARTLPQGKVRGSVGFSMLTSDQVNELVSEATGEDTNISIPLMDVGVRWGIGSNMDLGVRWSVPGGFQSRIKLSLIPGDDIAAAVGFGVGYLAGLGAIELFAPLYLSWDIHAQFGLYGVASYRVRIGTASGFSNGQLYVLGGGLRVGNSVGVMLEANHISEVGSDFSALQAGVAVFFGNGPSAKFLVGRGGHEVRWRRDRLDGVGADHVPYSAKVIRVGKKGRVAAVEHEKMRFWSKGKQLCIYEGTTKVGCGVVIRAGKKGAVMRFPGPISGLSVGQSVRSAADPPPKEEP